MLFRSKDIEEGVKDAHKKGIRTIIGGEVTVRTAQSLNLEGIEVSAGIEAVSRAIDESISILQEKQKEKNKSIQLKAAFNSIKEGIVVTDEKENIVVFNPVAEKVFGSKYQTGGKAGKDIINDKCRNVYKTHREENVYIKKMKHGTYSIMHSPIIEANEFIGVVSRFEDITKTQELEKKIRQEMHSKGFWAKYHFEDILTQNSEIKKLKSRAEIYAKTDSSILIEGESGTGKELFAQSIHNASDRRGGPFVAVNCTTIPENLLESELFGYEPGSFTGAKKEGKAGLFELAHKGTLFLDEIGEISKSLQTSLLRVIQEKEIMRVGGNKIIPIDVRIISATNKDLKERIYEGEFREDLYYRLNVLHIKVPSLRERKGDVELLAKNFYSQHNEDSEHLQNILSLLTDYQWPGNIRELQNAIERFGVLHNVLDQENLKKESMREILGIENNRTHENGENDIEIHIEKGKTLNEIVEQVEYDVTNRYLEEFDNNQELAANALGIGRTTFWRKSKSKNSKE